MDPSTFPIPTSYDMPKELFGVHWIISHRDPPKRERRTVGTLTPGDFFIRNGCLYILNSLHSPLANAVSLNDDNGKRGRMHIFLPEAEVEYCVEVQITV